MLLQLIRGARQDRTVYESLATNLPRGSIKYWLMISYDCTEAQGIIYSTVDATSTLAAIRLSLSSKSRTGWVSWSISVILALTDTLFILHGYSTRNRVCHENRRLKVRAHVAAKILLQYFGENSLRTPPVRRLRKNSLKLTYGRYGCCSST